jgi:hypothetical protein
MECTAYDFRVSASVVDTFTWLHGRAIKSGEVVSCNAGENRFVVEWRGGLVAEADAPGEIEICVDATRGTESVVTATVNAEEPMAMDLVRDFAGPLGERMGELQLHAPTRDDKARERRARFEARRVVTREKADARRAKLAARRSEIDEARPTKHKLGFGSGTILEHRDGSVSYRQSGSVTPAFRLNLADVTGFVVTKAPPGATFPRRLHLMGHGTELVVVEVRHGVAEKIEAWFKNHSNFSRGSLTVASQGGAKIDVLDQLERLGKLRDGGVLTEEEFQAKKREFLDR